MSPKLGIIVLALQIYVGMVLRHFSIDLISIISIFFMDSLIGYQHNKKDTCEEENSIMLEGFYNISELFFNLG